MCGAWQHLLIPKALLIDTFQNLVHFRVCDIGFVHAADLAVL